MSTAVLLGVYCLLIVLASLIGGWIPLLVQLTHRRLEIAVSLVAGVMLGVALFMLLPHAWMARADSLASLEAHDHALAIDHSLIDPVIWWVLIGFLAMFFVERFFRFHHHDSPGEHDHHGSSEQHGHPHDGRRHRHEMSWTGAAIGLTLHSLMDGIALGASVQVQTENGAVGLAGLATFLAILLHKPLDSISLGTLMAVGGRSRWSRHAVNGLFSLAVPFGAGLLFLGVGAAESGPQAMAIASAALAFSAGTFLCISLSDLLPELQFHAHDRIKLSLALLAGLALAWAAGLADPHRHGHDVHDGHDGHDHSHEAAGVDS